VIPKDGQKISLSGGKLVVPDRPVIPFLGSDGTCRAIFEVTHGMAPKYVDEDKVNPGSVILSGEMVSRHLGWDEAADHVVRCTEGAIGARTAACDVARPMKGEGVEDVVEGKCSRFEDEIVRHM
jgi:isocitrate dehydrogenase